MNLLVREFNTLVPTAATVLVDVTLILGIAFVVQPFTKRSPAARQAVLLWSLFAVGLCPAVVWALAHSQFPVVISAHELTTQAPLYRPHVFFSSGAWNVAGFSVTFSRAGLPHCVVDRWNAGGSGPGVARLATRAPYPKRRDHRSRRPH